MYQQICVFLIIFLNHKSVCSLPSHPVVKLNIGLVKGITNYTVNEEKKYLAFYGIPYAKPPLNDLRFLPPKPHDGWKGILNAQSERNICMQPSVGNFDSLVHMNEDCLYINVYTPSLNRTNLPVLVYIHGGGFVSGSSLYESGAPDYFLENDIIFVSFNYRLGIFGFYSTQDEVCPGNAGLKDQILALKWVKRNIKKFGGNAKDVTLFGQSAGAASISYLMQTPLTKGLFQRTIMESGSSLNSWALARNKRQIIFQTGKLLGIYTNDSSTLLKEMQQIPGSQLLLTSLENDVSIMAFTNPLTGLLFSPSIEPEHEGAVITGKSYRLLENGEFHKVPSIIGYNSLELSFDAQLISSVKLYLFAAFSKDLGKFTPVGMNISNATLQAFVGNRVAEYYNLKYSLFANDRNVTNYFSDDQFVRPITKLVELQSKWSPAYFYKFSYVGDYFQDFLNGVPHAQELTYIWANTNLTSTKDILTRMRMIRMWTNFIKTSNPTPYEDTLLQNVIWKKFNKTEINILNIGKDLIIRRGDSESQEFWENLFETYGSPPFDTF